MQRELDERLGHTDSTFHCFLRIKGRTSSPFLKEMNQARTQNA